MRYLIPLLAIFAILMSCKSHKDIVSDKSLDMDSLAHSEHHRTIATIDSVIRSTSFDFDTLEVNIERPTAYAEKPEFWCQRAQNGSSLPVMPSAAQNAPREIIRLKVTKGRVIDRQRVQRNQVEAYNSLDTVAYHQSATEASTEHTPTTRLYNPPDGTVVAIFAILGIACLIWLFFRKH